MNPAPREAGLILVLAGGVCLNHWQRLLGAAALAPASLQQGPLLPRFTFAVSAVALPSQFYLLLRGICSTYARLRPTNQIVTSRQWLVPYGLLPLLWGLLLAQHLPMGMEEGGQVLPVSLGLWWPELASQLPSWNADNYVIAFCQSLAVLMGAIGSLVLLRRLLLPSRWRWLWVSWLALGLGIGGRWLVAVG